MDFERKFDVFKTCKNTYTEQLCITDLLYGGYDEEMWSFGRFLPPMW
jgi:hypothetical protein